MEGVSPADGTVVHGVDLAQVDVLVKQHLQLFVPGLAQDDARHRMAVLAENPQGASRSFVTGLLQGYLPYTFSSAWYRAVRVSGSSRGSTSMRIRCIAAPPFAASHFGSPGPSGAPVLTKLAK